MHSPKIIKLNDEQGFAFIAYDLRDEMAYIYAYGKYQAILDNLFEVAPMNHVRLKLLLKQLRPENDEPRALKKTISTDWNWYMGLPDAMKDNIESHLGAPPFTAAQIRAAIERTRQKA